MSPSWTSTALRSSISIGRERLRRLMPERKISFHRTHGIRYFHGCYSLGDDRLWGVNRKRKGGDNTLKAVKSIRAARPDGAPIHARGESSRAIQRKSLGNLSRPRTDM